MRRIPLRGPVLRRGARCVSFLPLLVRLSSLHFWLGTYAFEVFHVVLALSQGLVFCPEHLPRDLGQRLRLRGNSCYQFLSFFLDEFLLQLNSVLLSDSVSFGDDVEDAAHGLLQLFHSSDLAGLADVGGVVFLGQFVSKDQVLLPHADVPQLVQIFCRFDAQFGGFPGATCIGKVVPLVMGLSLVYSTALSVKLAVILFPLSCCAFFSSAKAKSGLKARPRARELATILIITIIINYKVHDSCGCVDGSLLVLLLPLLLHLRLGLALLQTAPVVVVYCLVLHVRLFLLFLVVGAKGGVEAGLAQFPGDFLEALLVDDGIGGHLREGDVGAEDAERGVAGRRAVALHVDDPRRRLVVRDSQRHSQLFADEAGLVLSGLALVLFSLVEDVPEDCELALGLVLEEGVVEH